MTEALQAPSYAKVAERKESETTLLECRCRVIRVGEMFVELGYTSKAVPEKWSLLVKTEAMQEVHSANVAGKPSKIVKLRPGKTYMFTVKLFQNGSWGPPATGKFSMLMEVTTKCTSIGEDCAAFKWDRTPQPNEGGDCEEEEPALSSALRSITGYQIKILGQSDMEVVFHQSFEVGVRSYTVYGLSPGSRYIVMTSWQTLLGHQRQWKEVLRFETQPTFVINITGVGEDFLSASWGRGPAPHDTSDSVYQKSVVQALQYELVVDGGGRNMLSDVIELQPTDTMYTVTGLLPSETYTVKVRSMSTHARWGVYSGTVSVRTISLVGTEVLLRGEWFVKVRWCRKQKLDDELDDSYRLNILGVGHKFNTDVTYPIQQVRADQHIVTVPDLTPGKRYKIFTRACRNDIWGLWCEGTEFNTEPRPTVTCCERGEDFISVSWEGTSTYQIQAVNVSDGSVTHDKEFTGACPGYRVPHLTPQTQYKINIRTILPDGGHGMWSDPIVMTTLRPVVLRLVDIGEDFLQLSWKRALQPTTEDKPGTTATGSAKESTWFDLKYEVVLGCVDTGEDEILHKEVLETDYRINLLAPNTTYSVAVRACDEKEQWGLWSTVYFRTLSGIVLKHHEVGEDFARVVWEREATGPASTRLDNVFGADEFVSKYRLLLYVVEEGATMEMSESRVAPPSISHSHSTSSEESPDCDPYPPAAGSSFVFDKILDPSHTSYRIPDLQADRDYAIVVRASTKTGIKGLWSEPLKFRTVAPFVIPVNELSIGENYVHFTWGRDDNPLLPTQTHKGDYSVTSQQLRIRGLDDSYSLDRTLEAVVRDLKVYGLKPATAYCIQMRCCNSSGEWGIWSCDVRFQTRATIVMRTLEIAEDYIVVRWERKKSDDRDRGYPSGRGYITRYHLRVTGDDDFAFDAELVEADSPYRVAGLRPDTRYRVVIKANYNDDEWGLWSRPLECLTLRLIEVNTLLIGEEFAKIKWSRPEQSREVVPTNKDEEPIFCFGQRRPVYQLRVTTKDTTGPLTQGHLSWAGIGVLGSGTENQDSADSVDKLDQAGSLTPETKIVMETEITDTSNEVPFTVPNMKPDTHYSLAVRSKVEVGTWGVWSTVQKLVTLKPNKISFVVVGEDFARVTWERPMQNVVDSKIAKGRGIITKSQVKVKSPTGQIQTYDIDTALTTLTIEDYRPATTYHVAVRTFNDNYDWGLWSPDKAFRTVAGLAIDVESIGEDFISLAFSRQAETAPEEPGVNTVVSADTSVVKYQIRCSGDDGFFHTTELPGDAKRCYSLRGLVPNGVYEVAVRGRSRYDAWGQWSRLNFQCFNRLEISFGNIGEQFVVLQWERPTNSAGTAGVNMKQASHNVSKYRLRVTEVDNPTCTRLYDLPTSCKDFKVPDLQPNSEYSVWITSCNFNGDWGVWSVEKRVHTLPPLQLTIDDIGEAYASVNWERNAVLGSTPQPDPVPGDDGIITTKIPTSRVKEFHVKVEGRQGVVVERTLEPGVQGCKVEGLEVDTLYHVMVRMKDAEGDWGLWSTTRRFITLRPVELSVQMVGENFVHLDWGRRRERVKDLDSLGFQASNILEEDEEVEEDEEDEENEEDEEKSNDRASDLLRSPMARGYEDDADIAVGSEEVQRWLVRVHGHKVSWDDNHSEFELNAEELSKRIADLEPNTKYTISVRALSASGQWGFWSEEQVIITLPLMRTSVSYIGEDFIVVTWDRPKNDTRSHDRNLGIFPAENAVHSYQLNITPVDVKDSNSNVERDFDVSQPKYEVWDMQPGTRYAVGVREKDLEGSWGMWSERRTVQTLDPIGLKLLDLGECFGCVKWERVPRPRPPTAETFVSEAESTLYQVSVDRVEKKVITERTDPFHMLRVFKKGETEWNIFDLSPNKVYSVKVRCQTDGEYWGAWSEPLLFVTMKMLTVTVELINEENALLSWNRDYGDWMVGNDSQSSAGSTAEMEMPSEASEIRAPDKAQEEWDLPDNADVKTGNYDVLEFELCVEGLVTESVIEHKLPPHVNTFRVSGLSADQLYSITIRSKNTLSVWSMWSHKVSLLTLNPIAVTIGKVTESFVWANWGRAHQNPDQYSRVLQEISLKKQQEIQRIEEERQKERKRRVAEQEHGHDQEVEEEEAEDTKKEEEAAYVPDPYLLIENLNIASRDCTAFHLKMWGDSGYPLCPPASCTLPADDPFLQAAAERKKKREQRAAATRTKKDQKQRSAVTTGKSAKTQNKGRKKAKIKTDAKDDTPDLLGGEDDMGSQFQTQDDPSENVEDVDDDADRCLLDSQLRRGVFTLKTECLSADTLYTFSVRARNADGEWGIWSPKTNTRTLVPLKLCNSRFGEHYINLYWYRPSQEELLLEQKQDKQRKEYEELRRQQEERERLEKNQAERNGVQWVKTEPPQEMKDKQRKEARAHKARVREHREKSEQRKEGKGEIYVPSETIVDCFLLRVISEDGTIEDRTLEAIDESGQTALNLYTVANLVPNHLYIVRLAICYEGEWGEWSAPTKFMTQNLLQLSISYVGESFIQLDWKRAPNKRLKGEDMSQIRTTPTEQGLGHHYQISVLYELENKTTGLTEEKKQSVDVVDTNSFRITGLVSDMKYQLAVREWDRKGDWGLWSPQRCCMTLSRMIAAINDIGENWIEVSWERMQPRIKYDDPSMVSIPVSVTAYYLNIEELGERDLMDDAEKNRIRAAEAAERAAEEAAQAEKEKEAAAGDASSVDSDATDEEDQMAAHRRRQRRKELEDRQRLAELEAAVAESEKGVLGPDGRYRMTRKLDPSVSTLIIDNLKSDRICNVRVQAETSGNELGVWSPDCFFVTMKRIYIEVELVAEDSFTVTWSRPPNRKHPLLEYVHEGDTTVMEYEAEVQGRGTVAAMHVTRTFSPAETTWRVGGLAMDSVYAFSARSKDPKERWSLLSPPMEIVTLRQMRVFPIKTTEQLMIVQWGRDQQSESDYPQRTAGSEFFISQERTMQYHLKVWNNNDRKSTLVDKTFIGTLNRYVINYLTPNTTYFIEARACNAAGEWGSWSSHAEVFTMKLLNLEVDAVGESYVKTRWWRHAPDATLTIQDESAEPNLEQQCETVYTSPETEIDKFQVTITLLGSDQEWEWATDVPNTNGTATCYTIEKLLPDKRYQVQVRASYKDDEWGTPSPHVATATLNVVSVEAVQAGEDYLTAQWHRLLHTYQPQWGDAELHLGSLEKTLKWEYRVTNISDCKVLENNSMSGQDKLDDMNGVVVKEAFTEVTNATFEGLEPNQRYRVEVRYWYLPIEVVKTSVSASPAIEELDDQAEQDETIKGQPGIWGEATHVATLKPMVAIIDEIAEDFFSLRWERDPGAKKYPQSCVSELNPEIQGYHVVIDQLDTLGQEKDMAEGTLHIDHKFGPDETAFRVTNLVPATCYNVVVRACADGQWGLWSKACVLITLPKLSVTISNIGEDYVVLSWDRLQNQLEHCQAMVGSSANVSRYHLEMYGVDHPYHTDKKFKSTRTTYKVKRLEANAVYSVRVRSCDANNVWSLWSDQVTLVTLKPISVTFGKVAEQFVHINWLRGQQNADEYQHDPAPVMPETAVTKYHLCVFAAEHTPSAPLVDKQFSGETTSFKVSSLNPNSLYIVIVRAANTEGQWGSWSEERTALTLPLLNIKTESVGENYITIGWDRDEPPQAALQCGIVVDSTEWHIVVTSHDLQYEKKVTAEELLETNNFFTTRSLKPDSKYIITLRACYGEGEWGLWTNPVTFLTLNQLGLTVSNISEDKADFTWGRGVQSAQHTYDPNVVIWKGLITKYSLSIKKVLSTGNIPDFETSGKDDDNQLSIEREMEINRYKYIQTYCTSDELHVNTEYMVKVRAQDDHEEWGEWTELVFETPPLPPGKPILKKAHSNYIAFDWEPPDPYNRYLYCVEQAISKTDKGVKKDEKIGSDGALEWKVVDTVSESYAKIKTTTALTKCRFRVKCCKMDKSVHLWSRYSSVAAFTTAVPPEPAQNLTITSLSKSTATLEWARPAMLQPAPPPVQQTAQTSTTTTAPNKTGPQQKITFKIMLGEKDGPVQFMGTTRVCRYELTDLKPNTHYRVQVQVETENGVSARNTILKFSTRADTAGSSRQHRQSITVTERMASTAPVPPTTSRDMVGDTQQSSESSDTLGNKVRLPVLSPPKTAPLQSTSIPHISARPPIRPPMSPPPRDVPRRPSVPSLPVPRDRRPVPQYQEESQDILPDLGGAEVVPGSPAHNADGSHHSDEEYDVVSLQHSDDST